MSKLLSLVLVLTLTPGYLWWIVVAALLPGVCLLLEDVAEWLRTRHTPALVPVRVDRSDVRPWVPRR